VRLFNDHIPDPNLDLGFTTESPLTAFARAIIKANVLVLPHDGTVPEKVAMTFHEGCLGQACSKSYPTYTPEGNTSKFFVNGLPRQPGAPYADPCKPEQVTGTRSYAAAYIQFDMPVNLARWHDRQARILTLENDALATIGGGINGARPRTPEPLFFRANSGECVVFKATNLIPNNLNLDDFQIFTPTDIMGQHIHLVKFDVTSSDGAGNGWNYEDGTFSPGEVQERVRANNLFQEESGGKQVFTLVTNPKFGGGPDLDGNRIGDYVGAQTTVQRWWADPLVGPLALSHVPPAVPNPALFYLLPTARHQASALVEYIREEAERSRGEPRGATKMAVLSVDDELGQEAAEGALAQLEVTRSKAVAAGAPARPLTLAFRAVAFAAAKVFTEGVKLSGRRLSRAGLVVSIEQLRDFRTGVLPPLTFGPNRRAGVTGAYIVGVDSANKRLTPLSDLTESSLRR
jgi:hypothetical protein